MWIGADGDVAFWITFHIYLNQYVVFMNEIGIDGANSNDCIIIVISVKMEIARRLPLINNSPKYLVKLAQWLVC